MAAITAAQITVNQITMEDLSRVNAHTSYNQLVSQAAASKYVPVSGLASGGKSVVGTAAIGFAAVTFINVLLVCNAAFV